MVSTTTKGIMVVIGLIGVIENTIRNTTIEKKGKDNLKNGKDSLNKEKNIGKDLHKLNQRKRLL
jgi:hypothetical protein